MKRCNSQESLAMQEAVIVLTLLEMVGMARFERATTASRTQCPTRLGHIPTENAVYIIYFMMSIIFKRLKDI